MTFEGKKVKKYAVTFNGVTYHHRVELVPSGAFDYGNGTCVVHYREGEPCPPQSYDTRYEVGIIENFDSWADDFIKSHCNSECVIVPEE